MFFTWSLKVGSFACSFLPVCTNKEPNLHVEYNTLRQSIGSSRHYFLRTSSLDRRCVFGGTISSKTLDTDVAKSYVVFIPKLLI